MKQLICMALAMLGLSACVAPVPHAKYEWGNYEQSMYGYYKNPSNPAALTASLAAIIKKAEAQHTTVAPGLYAEYGYLLMLQGNQQGALDNFEKEKRKWPASVELMERMSNLAMMPQAAATAEVKQ